MQALSTLDLLSAWDQGQLQSATQRALMLLSAADPETPIGALAQLSVGERDARLLQLREWTFGGRFAGLADCPGCGERLELDFEGDDVRAPAEPLGEKLTFKGAGYDVTFRLPNSLDLATLSAGLDIRAARKRLLERCVLSALHNGESMPPGQLPESVIGSLSERMAEADPQGDIQLALKCPLCGLQWQAIFDVVSFFWSEINAWAARLLREVHQLAAAYGWRELDILSMSASRRQFYLEMLSE